MDKEFNSATLAQIAAVRPDLIQEMHGIGQRVAGESPQREFSAYFTAVEILYGTDATVREEQAKAWLAEGPTKEQMSEVIIALARLDQLGD